MECLFKFYLTQFSQQTCEIDAVIVLMSQVRKMQFSKERTELLQGV